MYLLTSTSIVPMLISFQDHLGRQDMPIQRRHGEASYYLRSTRPISLKPLQLKPHTYEKHLRKNISLEYD